MEKDSNLRRFYPGSGFQDQHITSLSTIQMAEGAGIEPALVLPRLSASNRTHYRSVTPPEIKLSVGTDSDLHFEQLHVAW